MKELIMVKVFVDKVDGDIVFTHYLEENDRTGNIHQYLMSEQEKFLSIQKDWKFVHSFLDMQNKSYILRGKKQEKFQKCQNLNE